MKNLQREHAEWLIQKYPDQHPKIPAVGCLEEAGELVHAVLKMEQVRVWGENDRHKLAELRVKLVDAIGDCGIYACSLCNANEWDFYEVWGASEPAVTFECDTLDAAIVLVQRGAEVALNASSKSSLMLASYLYQLRIVAGLLGLDAETAILSTWKVVKCR